MTIAAVFFAAAIAAASPHWVGTWASAQQVPEPNNAVAPADLTDATVRETLRVSLGGPRFRVRLSNAFGTQPLTLSAHVALAPAAGAASIVAGTDHALTVAGSETITLPAGAEYWSDPVDMTLPAQSVVSVSLYYATPPAQQSGHPAARSTVSLVHGNHVADVSLDAPKTCEHWLDLSGIDVDAPGTAVVTLGDSITDGRGSTTNGNNRWPDVLAQRLTGQHVSVLNAGLGGNRVLLDGLGPNAASRLSRDILAQTGARYVIVLEGVNDLGTSTRDGPITAEAHAALVTRMETAYAQMIQTAHDHGIKIYGATIMPFMGFDYYHPDAANEADRQALNTWIRTPGRFDAVLDFDQVMRDDQHPDHLRADYDSGDHIHPSVAGHRAMGEAIPLSLFTEAGQSAQTAGHKTRRHRHR